MTGDTVGSVSSVQELRDGAASAVAVSSSWPEIAGPVAAALRSVAADPTGRGLPPVRSVMLTAKTLRARDEPLLRPGETGMPFDEGRTIGELAGYSVPVAHGHLLFALARHLRPRRVLEIGTNIGISAGYIASGLDAGGHLWTLEGSPARVRVAGGVLTDLCVADRVTLVPGRFEETLEPTLEEVGGFDLVFVDGNHQDEPTRSYYRMLAGRGEAVTALVFDDIRWSEGMARAWNWIVRRPATRWSLDLGRLGVVLT
jgi:predicted O-methyltransferase YrrM